MQWMSSAVFTWPPEEGSAWTPAAAKSLVGQTFDLEGISATVTDAVVRPDGYLTVTMVIPEDPDPRVR